MAADVQAQRPALDRSFSASVLERPSSSDQDPSAMTVEFLRARLLSERSVSKAARQRADQLAKKVLELEQRLETEIQLRKRLESARLEVLSKYSEELDTEHGDGFDSNYVEGDSDRTAGDPKVEGCQAGATSSSRSDDVERWERERAADEGFSGAIPPEDDEASHLQTLDRVDSTGQFNFEEDGNDGSVNDGEETDQFQGQEKGVLAWGSRGVRRQQSMERNGRSPKSYESTDAESPKKRLVGRSVRQKRKTENGVQDGNYIVAAQILDSADVEVSIARQDEKTGLQCIAERDTEVERVLERQAEFIERFEAEEIAQKAWEKKFREQNHSVGSAVDIHLQNEDKNILPDDTDRNNSKGRAKIEKCAVNSPKANGNAAAVHSEKAYGFPPSPSQAVTETALKDLNIVRNVTRKSAGIAMNVFSAISDKLHDDYSSSARDTILSTEEAFQENQREALRGAGDEARYRDASQERIDSSYTNIQTVEGERHVGKLDRQSELSSSFRFSGFQASTNQDFNMLTKNVSSTTPPRLQDHGIGRDIVKKAIPDPAKESIQPAATFSDHAGVGTAGGQSSDHVQPRTVSREELTLGFRKPTALGESSDLSQGAKHSFWSAGGTRNDSSQDMNQQASSTASNYHPSHMQHSVFPARTNDLRENTAVQAEEVADILEETAQRARTQYQWNVKNDASRRFSDHGLSDNLVWDSPWEEVFRRRIGVLDTIKQKPAGSPGTLQSLSPYQELHIDKPLQNGSANHSYRAKLGKFPPLPGRRNATRDDYVPHEYEVGRNVHPGSAFTSHRKSVDGGFDRLRGVLEALEIAKQHVQSSQDQGSDLNPAYRNGYDNRDAVSRNPQYSKDGHVRDTASGSLQPSNDRHVHRRAEQKPYTMPHTFFNSNEYRHHARQPAWF